MTGASRGDIGIIIAFASGSWLLAELVVSYRRND